MKKLALNDILTIIRSNHVERRADAESETYMVRDARGNTLAVINNDWGRGAYAVAVPGHRPHFGQMGQEPEEETTNAFEIIRASREIYMRTNNSHAK